jgi:hypothetical protein
MERKCKPHLCTKNREFHIIFQRVMFLNFLAASESFVNNSKIPPGKHAIFREELLYNKYTCDQKHLT